MDVQLSDETFVDGMAGLKWRLRAILSTGARHIVVDLKRVQNMSSSAVAALLGAHRVCRARGGGVILRNPNRHTVELLLRNGLHYVFRIEGANSHLTRREYAVPDLRESPARRPVSRRRRRIIGGR